MEKQPVESVIGIIEAVSFLAEGTAKTTGKPWKKYQVTINSDDSFIAWDGSYESKIGQEGEWKFRRDLKYGKKNLLDLNRPPAFGLGSRPAAAPLVPKSAQDEMISLLADIHAELVALRGDIAERLNSN